MDRYIARLTSNEHVDKLREHGEVIFAAKLLPIVGIVTTEEKLEEIRKLPFVQNIEKERIGYLCVN